MVIFHFANCQRLPEGSLLSLATPVAPGYPRVPLTSKCPVASPCSDWSAPCPPSRWGKGGLAHETPPGTSGGRGSWIGNKRSVMGKKDDIPHDSLWNPMIKAWSYYITIIMIYDIPCVYSIDNGIFYGYTNIPIYYWITNGIYQS